MKIGILQTGHSPDEVKAELGDYADMFVRLLDGHGFEFETYSVVDGQFPSGPDAADGWLITGSKHGVYEDHTWIPPLEQFIRDVQAIGLPMIGVCFGHQIIAQALGGKVEKFAKGWAAGPQTYDFEGKPMVLNAWHQDQVTQVPPSARVVATNAFCENAALLYGDHIFTVQPHPEFAARMLEGLITHRAPGVLSPEQIADAAAKLDAPLDDRAMADWMAAFLKGQKS
ncbi:type 1 glutamine amidotransferase [Thalassovita taeanensis]|uniref:GMP synthase-Glutamine amidotransferase n=1 Tax=Thalassovita taeanensis TaxID=657014 RepID=A0A1H9L4T3_9RHOB|nr:type 1 glutamine amidotransferase [Thalassovita taeanensis]SER06492.1 GMP synthase-Glutamine amidotransferase [Thalassovita taeanensis]